MTKYYHGQNGINSLKIRYVHIILFLLVYFTMEDLILKFLPMPLELKGYLRFGGEIVLYMVFAYFLGTRVVQGHWHKATPIDTYFYLLLGLFVLNTIFYGVNPIRSFLAFRTIFRYLAAFYILVSISISDRDVRRFMGTVVVIGILQAVLALMQHLLGREFTNFFIPETSDLEIAGVTKEFRIHTLNRAHNAIGTFGHTVTLAIFQVLTCTVLLAYFYYRPIKSKVISWAMKPKVLVVFLGLLLVSIFVTYTRASALVAILIIIVLGLAANQLKKLIYYGVIASVFAIPLLAILIVQSSGKEVTNPIDDFTHIFSRDYLENEASNNRLWVLTKAVPIAVAKPNLIGYGGDVERIRTKIYEESGYKLDRILVYGPIKDVYWVTIFFYYGFIGLGLFIFIQYKVYKAADYLFRNDGQRTYKILGLAMKGFVIVMAILSFFVVTWEFRPIAFTFWSLAGLAINRKRELIEERENTVST